MFWLWAKESDVLLYLDEDDGRLEYKGELIFDNMKYEFKIDAYSGGLMVCSGSVRKDSVSFSEGIGGAVSAIDISVSSDT